jgi:flavin reductase (DIM6/NTAB) family NADH-FMN oxidoreductase RutF
MHYRPGKGSHGLPHNPFKAIIAPRPIAWVSTLDAAGRVNLAPFSFFNGVSDSPPMVMISVGESKIGVAESKDTLANIRATGEFAIGIVGWEHRDAMNRTSGHYPAGEDEFALAGLEKAACLEIAPPRIADAPATLECKLHQIVKLPEDIPGEGYSLIIGEVVAVHLRDDCIHDGSFDLTRHQPVARCGYKDYAVVREVFQMTRPGQS